MLQFILFLLGLYQSSDRFLSQIKLPPPSPPIVKVVTQKKVIKKVKASKLVNPLSKAEIMDVKTYICQKWGEAECAKAQAIANAENGDFNPLLISPTNDVGIMQINKVHWRECGGLEALKDPYKNVDCAYGHIYKASNFQPWTTYNTGEYKKYLPLYK